MEQQRLWTRSFIVLMGVNLCCALSFYLITVKITEFAVDTYGVPQSLAAMTVTVYVITALLTRLFFGKRIDSWGVKRTLAIGAVINAVAMVLYLIPAGFVPLIIVRIIQGFAFALTTGSAAASAALIIPRDRFGEGIGYFSMMQALATGVGPFVAILLTNMFGGYTAMFVVAAVIGILAAASIPFVDIPKPDDKHLEAHHMKVHGVSSLIQIAIVPLVSALFLVYMGYSGILTFVTSYADWRGLSDAVTLYFVVYAIVILISRPPVGRRVDRKGENSTIYFCFASLAIGFVVLAFAVNGALLLASAAFAGFGIGATQSIVQAVIARETPPTELGKANSTFFMSMDLGSGIGPIVIGAIIPVIGYSGSYLFLAVCAVLAGVVYHFAHGRHH